MDVRHALRSFARNPGFTLAVVASLALGIGANTAIFSAINTVLLKPLPYPEPERIVQFQTTSPAGAAPWASAPLFQLLRRQVGALENPAAYDFGGPGLNLTDGDRPEQVKGTHVTADYFRLFGAPVILGRTFTAEEDQRGGRRVAVLSHGLWERRYGGDPAILGKSISLGGEPYEVIGVLGASYTPDQPADVWLPFQLDPLSPDQARYFLVGARLKSGATLSAANAELEAAAERFRADFPGAAGPQERFSLRPLQEAIVGDVRASLLVLAGAVSLVLLVACANVANLLLIRAVGRRREVAVRVALGAGRARIIRQVLTESLMLSTAGGLAGLWVGLAGLRALLAASNAAIPRVGEAGSAVRLDGTVLGFTLLASIVTGAMFGLIPAIATARADPQGILKESGGRSGTGWWYNRARSLLVTTEIALAVVLLVGAALLMRTFVALRSLDPGFERHNVLTMEMSLAGPRFRRTADVENLLHEVVRRTEAVPGVVSAGATCCLPLEPGYGFPFVIEGRPPVPGSPPSGASWRSVSPRYFDVFRITVVRGRAFTDRDNRAAIPVVAINQAMARQFWPDADPIGQWITIGVGIGPDFQEPPRQVVGIVGDVRDASLQRDPRPILYVPLAQVKDEIMAVHARLGPLAWIFRTRGEPHAMRVALEDEIRRASGGLPVGRVRSMDEIVARSTSRTDFNMVLLDVFGATALFLAAVGIYGLVAYSVEQRTQEIGIRLALGAHPSSVRDLFVWQGMRWAFAGLAAGLAASFAVTRLLAGLLFGVHSTDPLAFTVVPAVLCSVALGATWIAARRATRVDPIDALRE